MSTVEAPGCLRHSIAKGRHDQRFATWGGTADTMLYLQVSGGTGSPSPGVA